MDYFYKISEDIIDEIKIKKSTFICHLKYTETLEESKEFISTISKEHKNANHNCWAYIIGKKGEIFHSSDNGEPAGTAGKPMLNTLFKYNLTNVTAVVTRYFGGIKLGIRGLIDAYSESVESAISKSDLIKIVDYDDYEIQTTYDFAEIFKYNLNQFGTEIEDITYTEMVTLKIKIEKTQSESLEKYLNDLDASGKITLK